MYMNLFTPLKMWEATTIFFIGIINTSFLDASVHFVHREAMPFKKTNFLKKDAVKKMIYEKVFHPSCKLWAFFCSCHNH